MKPRLTTAVRGLTYRMTEAQIKSHLNKADLKNVDEINNEGKTALWLAAVELPSIEPSAEWDHVYLVAVNHLLKLGCDPLKLIRKDHSPLSRSGTIDIFRCQAEAILNRLNQLEKTPEKIRGFKMIFNKSIHNAQWDFVTQCLNHREWLSSIDNFNITRLCSIHSFLNDALVYHRKVKVLKIENFDQLIAAFKTLSHFPPLTLKALDDALACDAQLAASWLTYFRLPNTRTALFQHSKYQPLLEHLVKLQRWQAVKRMVDQGVGAYALPFLQQALHSVARAGDIDTFKDLVQSCKTAKLNVDIMSTISVLDDKSDNEDKAGKDRIRNFLQAMGALIQGDIPAATLACSTMRIEDKLDLARVMYDNPFLSVALEPATFLASCEEPYINPINGRIFCFPTKDQPQVQATEAKITLFPRIISDVEEPSELPQASAPDPELGSSYADFQETASVGTAALGMFSDPQAIDTDEPGSSVSTSEQLKNVLTQLERYQLSR